MIRPQRNVKFLPQTEKWYEFVECGKVQVRRGRVTTPYRMGETKVNTKIPSPSPGGQGAGRPTACLHTNISPKPKVRYKPKNLYRTFFIILSKMRSI